MAAYATMLDSLSNAITSVSSLTHSSQVIDATYVPNSQTNGTFSFDLQTSNTGASRDRTTIRLDHDLTVNVLWRVKMNDQFTSQKEAADIELTIIDALMTQSNVATYNVFYVNTDRALLRSREYMLIKIVFKVSQSLSITS